MNRIDTNITLSSLDLDALEAQQPPVELQSPRTPVRGADLELSPELTKPVEPAAETFKDAGIDAVCVDPIAAPSRELASPQLERPFALDVIELPKISLALSTIRRYATSLANLLSSVRSMIIRTPAFRPDSQLAERLTRTQEDVKREDDVKNDLRRRLIVQEPMDVTTSQVRIQRVVGDEIVTETITTEHHRSSLVADGKVTAELESTSTKRS